MKLRFWIRSSFIIILCCLIVTSCKKSRTMEGSIVKSDGLELSNKNSNHESGETNKNTPKEIKKIEDTNVVATDEFYSTSNIKYKIEFTLLNPAIDGIKYTNIRIYDTTAENKKVIFDLNEQGNEIDGIMTEDGKYFEVEDRNHDGVEELYFDEYVYASNMPRKLILTHIDGEYKVAFYDGIYNPKYIDCDNDNKYELYGITRGGGQVSYDEGFSVVHLFKDSKYKPSYEHTWKYENRDLGKYEEEFTKNPSVDSLDNLIHRYAYLGMIDGCKRLLTDNSYLIEELDKYFQENKDKENYNDQYGYYIYRAEIMANFYKEIWDNFKSDNENRK